MTVGRKPDRRPSAGGPDLPGGPAGRSARVRILRLFTLFISLRVTTVVLLVLFGAIALGAVLPQGRPPGEYSDRFGAGLGGTIRVLGLDHMFHTWWFAVLLTVFFLQVLLCTVGRFRTAWVQLTNPARFRPEGVDQRAIVAAPLDVVVRRARRLGYREVGRVPAEPLETPPPLLSPPSESTLMGAPAEAPATPEGGIVLARGRLQPLGFILLHVSLLVLLVGVTWSLAGGFSQALYLPQGERVLEQHTNRTLELDRYAPEYAKVTAGGGEGGFQLAGAQAAISVYDGPHRLKAGTLSLGRTLTFDRGQVVLAPGPSRHQVVLRVTQPSGNVVVDRLSFADPRASLPGRDDLVLTVKDFAPDAERKGESWRRISPALVRPLVSLEVAKGDGSTSAAAILSPGESLRVEGYAITFREAVPMPRVVVSSRTGSWLVSAGIVANLLGVVLSLAFSFRQLTLVERGGSVEARGFARRRNQPLCEELDALSTAGPEEQSSHMVDAGWQGAIFVGALVGMVIAWVSAIAGAVWERGEESLGRRRWVRRVFWIALGLSVACQTGLLVALSVRRGTIAIYNQAEFLFAFAWAVSLVMGFFMLRRGPWWVAVTVAPMCFLVMGYVLLVPGTSGEVSLASVRSVWLLLHILTSVVAYASFTVTFGAGVMLLLRRYTKWGRSLDPASVNRIGYRAAVFGFPFMTMVLFTGALWSKYLNGVYWAWDPIENWALVTWLVYAAYLHAQYTRGWEGVRAAWLSVVGFGCVVSTYIFFTHYWF